MLDEYIDLQRLSLRVLYKRRLIESQEKSIEQRSSNYRNIDKAYSRMIKAYDDFGEIANQEDLRRYDRQCDRILEMQQAFLDLLASETVQEADNRLKRESDITKIKLVLGLN